MWYVMKTNLVKCDPCHVSTNFVLVSWIHWTLLVCGQHRTRETRNQDCTWYSQCRLWQTRWACFFFEMLVFISEFIEWFYWLTCKWTLVVMVEVWVQSWSQPVSLSSPPSSSLCSIHRGGCSINPVCSINIIYYRPQTCEVVILRSEELAEWQHCVNTHILPDAELTNTNANT